MIEREIARLESILSFFSPMQKGRCAVATKHDSVCLQKAGDAEPIFVLRAQDMTAPVLVRVWAGLLVQLRFLELDDPATVVSALRHFEARLLDVLPVSTATPSGKVLEALAIADAMEHWPHRKVPD